MLIRQVWVKFTLYILVFLFLVISTVVSWRSVDSNLNLSAISIFQICTLHSCFLLLNAKRIQVLISMYTRVRVDYFRWLRIFIDGALINKILPQAGNLYRGVALKRWSELKYAGYVGALIWLSWIDVMLCLAAAALLLMWSDDAGASFQYLPVVSIAMLAMAVAPFICIYALQFLPSNGSNSSVRAISESLRLAISPALKRRNFVGMKVVATLGLIGMFLMAYRLYVGFDSLGVELDFVDLLLLFTLYKVTTFMVITPGNLGVQEASIGALSELLGYSFSLGFFVSLLLRFCGYVVFAVLGGFSLLIRCFYSKA